MNDKGGEVQNQVITMSKQGQIGAVSIDFKVFAWQCKPGSSSLRVSVWRALILIFKPFSFLRAREKVCCVTENNAARTVYNAKITEN